MAIEGLKPNIITTLLNIDIPEKLSNPMAVIWNNWYIALDPNYMYM